MAEPIQLLTLGAQVTQNAFDRIDRAMTQNLATQQRAGEFAVGMTAKAAEFAETARMHDATIDNMKFDNYMRGQQFQLNKELLPYKIAEANMGLAVQAERLKRENMTTNKFMMNELFGTYDNAVGMEALKNHNPQYMQDYLNYRGRWVGHVANGGKFDAVMFEQGIGTINNKYIGNPMPENAEWSADMQLLYDSISPNIGKAYQMKNPIIAKNKNGLAVGMLNMTEQQYGSQGNIQMLSTLFDGEETGLLAIGRNKYQQNLITIENGFKELSRFKAAAATLSEDDPNKSSYESYAADIQKQIEAARSENALISQNYSQGKYGIPSEPVKTDAKPKPNPEDLSSYLNKKPDSGISQSTDIVTQKLGQRIADVRGALIPTIGNDSVDKLFGGQIDFSWFEQNKLDEQPDKNTMGRFKEYIEENISAIGNMSGVLTEEKTVNDLLGKIKKPITVPVSEWTIEKLYGKVATGKETGPYYGYSSATKKTSIDIGGSKKAGATITSFEDIQKLVSQIKNKHEREEVQKELLSSLLAASIGNAVINQ